MATKQKVAEPKMLYEGHKPKGHVQYMLAAIEVKAKVPGSDKPLHTTSEVNKFAKDVCQGCAEIENPVAYLAALEDSILQHECDKDGHPSWKHMAIYNCDPWEVPVICRYLSYFHGSKPGKGIWIKKHSKANMFDIEGTYQGSGNDNVMIAPWQWCGFTLIFEESKADKALISQQYQTGCFYDFEKNDFRMFPARQVKIESGDTPAMAREKRNRRSK